MRFLRSGAAVSLVLACFVASAQSLTSDKWEYVVDEVISFEVLVPSSIYKGCSGPYSVVVLTPSGSSFELPVTLAPGWGGWEGVMVGFAHWKAHYLGRHRAFLRCGPYLKAEADLVVSPKDPSLITLYCDQPQYLPGEPITFTWIKPPGMTGEPQLFLTNQTAGMNWSWALELEAGASGTAPDGGSQVSTTGIVRFDRGEYVVELLLDGFPVGYTTFTVVGFGILPPTKAWLEAGTFYRLANRATGKYLTVDLAAGGGVGEGGNVFQWNYLPHAAQLWRVDLSPGPGSVYTIASQHSAKVLAPVAVSAGASVKQESYEFGHRPSQYWHIQPLGGNFYRIWNMVAYVGRHCLDVAGASTANGADVVLNPCYCLQPSQVWEAQPLGADASLSTHFPGLDGSDFIQGPVAVSAKGTPAAGTPTPVTVSGIPPLAPVTVMARRAGFVGAWAWDVIGATPLALTGSVTFNWFPKADESYEVIGWVDLDGNGTVDPGELTIPWLEISIP